MKLTHILEARTLPDVADVPFYPKEIGRTDPDDEPSPEQQRTMDADSHDMELTQAKRRAGDKQTNHMAKLSDVEYDQEYPNGTNMAPVTIQTGIAADPEAAQQQIAQVSRGAWQVYDKKTTPLPDGRVKYMIKYML